MTPEQLKERLTCFAADVVKLTGRLRVKPEARHIADQLSDSATSTAVNYRSACRARSHREFISKLAVAVEEADESVGWLDIVKRTALVDDPGLDPALKEAREVLAILAASRRTAEERGAQARTRPRPQALNQKSSIISRQ